MLLAGGTDLVPNLKHGLFAPERLVSIRRVDALRDARERGRRARPAARACTSPRSPSTRACARAPRWRRPRAWWPGRSSGRWARSAATSASTRAASTTTRPTSGARRWASASRRTAPLCHVVPKGKRCVAAYSADTPSPLMTYDASLTLASVRGERTIPVTSFFRAEGTHNTVREPDELVLGVTLPKPRPGLQSAYVKLRVRQAVDFPVLSVAVTVVLGAGRRVEDLSLIVGAVAAQPRVVKGAADAARGRTLDEDVARDLGKLAHTQCHFLPSSTWTPPGGGTCCRSTSAAPSPRSRLPPGSSRVTWR